MLRPPTRALRPALLLLALLAVLWGPSPAAGADDDDDDPNTAQVRVLQFKKVTETEVTIMVQLTDVPQWSEEQPFFLVPEHDPETIHVPLRYNVGTLTAGKYCDIRFKGLEPNTKYNVKLNWSLKAPAFPGGWSFWTLAPGGEL
mmetsp:Transcript_43040/g.136807  ORF Transcript_43040/g.136807 Transcript_43040/m.136807 type:complete len:144 (-) Transcript_43040:90-521(-)